MCIRDRVHGGRGREGRNGRVFRRRGQRRRRVVERPRWSAIGVPDRVWVEVGEVLDARASVAAVRGWILGAFGVSQTRSMGAGREMGERFGESNLERLGVDNGSIRRLRRRESVGVGDGSRGQRLELYMRDVHVAFFIRKDV